MENKMYLTGAEAKAKGLPSPQEQIDRYNRAIEIHWHLRQVERILIETEEREAVEAKADKRGRRNPAFKLVGDPNATYGELMSDSLADMAARAVLSEATRNTTANEKLLLATMIPMFLKLIRKTEFELGTANEAAGAQELPPDGQTK